MQILMVITNIGYSEPFLCRAVLSATKLQCPVPFKRLTVHFKTSDVTNKITNSLGVRYKRVAISNILTTSMVTLITIWTICCKENEEQMQQKEVWNSTIIVVLRTMKPHHPQSVNLGISYQGGALLRHRLPTTNTTTDEYLVALTFQERENPPSEQPLPNKSLRNANVVVEFLSYSLLCARSSLFFWVPSEWLGWQAAIGGGTLGQSFCRCCFYCCRGPKRLSTFVSSYTHTHTKQPIGETTGDQGSDRVYGVL